MFLIRNTISTFVVILLMSSSSYGGAKAPYIYIPSTVLKKESILGFEIKEVNSSSYSEGIFIFFQKYRPSSTTNPFNGSPNEIRV